MIKLFSNDRLAAARKKRDRLAAELDATDSKIEQSKNALDRAADGDADLQNVARRLSALKLSAEALSKALERADADLTTAEAEAEAAKKQADRDATAERLEKKVTTVTKATRAIDKAIDGLMKARAEFIASVEDEVHLPPVERTLGSIERGAAEQAADVILTAGLRRALPDAFVLLDDQVYGRVSAILAHSILNGMPRLEAPGSRIFHSSEQAAALLVTDRLQRSIAALRAGEIDDVSDQKPSNSPGSKSAPYREMQIFVLKPFKFIASANRKRVEVHPNWTQWLPEPVAKAAINAGFALDMETAAGLDALRAEEATRARRRENPARPAPDEFHDLGNPLALDLQPDPEEDEAA